MKTQKTLTRNLTAVLLSVLLVAFASASFAEDGAIRFSNNAFKQVATRQPDGSFTYDYEEPKLVLPKDIILYEIKFENISDQEISNIIVSNPIANNSVYRAGSASGASTEITFTVDGEHYAPADALTVKDSSGKSWKAKPEDYTAIRWIYKSSLKPGETGKVTYKTMIK